MPKRTLSYPYRRSEGEQKLNSQKHYNELVKKPSKINPIWLQDNYGVVKTEVVNGKEL